MRPAAKLVTRAMAFQSTISLRLNERLADARSILAVLLLSAGFGAVMDLEVSGDDEEEALASLTEFFEAEAVDSDGDGRRPKG